MADVQQVEDKSDNETVDSTLSYLSVVGGAVTGAVAARLMVENRDDLTRGARAAAGAAVAAGEHIQNRPLQAAAEAVSGGAAGVVGGALAERALQNPQIKQGVNNAMQEAGRIGGKIAQNPLNAQGIIIEEAAKGAAAGAVQGAKAVGRELQAIPAELDAHRQNKPTTSAIERGVGAAVGGVIGGAAAGTAIEVIHSKTSKYQEKMLELLGIK